MNKYFVVVYILLLTLIFSVTNSAQSIEQKQEIVEVKNLFASGSIVKDSIFSFLQVRLSFLINRPELVSRVEFKVGKDIDTGEFGVCVSTIEMRGNKYYCVYNGFATPLLGDKIVLNWRGDKSFYSQARYVTIRVQLNNGIIGNRVFAFIRQF